MFDQVSTRQLLGAVTVFALALGVSFGAGYLVNSGGTGAVTGDASTDEMRSTVQSLMDRQVQQQRQQFTTIANQSENISESDLSMDAQVTDVSPSEFGSLYAVDVQVTGTVPGQLGGGLQELDQEQTFYMSPDARYLFQQPQDLEQQTQQQQPPAQAPQ
ncbi:MAG: hypothetical protein MUP66_01270 [Candidatus Nanohaloarchaeota archaeon QJJ-5]|nr:hypothetical protein [Candidatus Nanohaloarchaeota archaeon QJJ-5]